MTTENKKWEFLSLEEKIDYLHRNLMGLVTFANNLSVRQGEMIDRLTKIEGALGHGRDPTHK